MHLINTLHIHVLLTPVFRAQKSKVVIICGPSFVHPSVCPSVVRLTIYIINFFPRINRLILMKLCHCMNEELKYPYKCSFFRPDLSKDGSRAEPK